MVGGGMQPPRLKEGPMKNVRTTAMAIAWLAVMPGLCLAAPSAGVSSQAKSASATKGKHEATHATRGVVKTVNDTTLVLTRTAGTGHEMAFVLDPATERVGTMEVGSTVDVRYHTKSKQHIATAVTVVHEKTAPAAGQ
jgi:hypothetical protein